MHAVLSANDALCNCFVAYRKLETGLLITHRKITKNLKLQCYCKINVLSPKNSQALHTYGNPLISVKSSAQYRSRKEMRWRMAMNYLFACQRTISVLLLRHSKCKLKRDGV